MKNTIQRAGAVLLLAVLAFTNVGLSHSDHDCEGFLPENDMKIPVGHQWKSLNSKGFAGGIDEAEFNRVIDRGVAIYQSEVAQAGGRLVVKRLWTNETVNASADRMGAWNVNMYGGLARHNEITSDGFALVLCHEIGHHIGGAPKVRGFFNTWATNEGGSDYFASLKCLRKMFENDNNAEIVANSSVDPLAREKCMQQFANQNEQDICMRISMAGDSVAGLFMAMRKESTRPTVATPDTKQVASTFDKHPATQCRFDTYYQGAICNVDKNVPVDQKDYRAGSCTAGNDGLRPRCWFKPN